MPSTPSSTPLHVAPVITMNDLNIAIYLQPDQGEVLPPGAPQ